MNKYIFKKSLGLRTAIAHASSLHALRAVKTTTGGNLTQGHVNISRNDAAMTVLLDAFRVIVEWRGCAFGINRAVSSSLPRSVSVSL